MKTFIAQVMLLLSGILLVVTSSLADEQKAGEFKPYRLAGGWKFVNSNTGVNYGGDIEVMIERIDSKGIMRGRISYDGRQTNDKCSTKALFTDKPVEVEVIKSDKEYRITFQVDCSTGDSPRVMSWTLVCADNMVCSQPTVLPWGEGAISLAERP